MYTRILSIQAVCADDIVLYMYIYTNTHTTHIAHLIHAHTILHSYVYIALYVQ